MSSFSRSDTDLTTPPERWATLGLFLADKERVARLSLRVTVVALVVAVVALAVAVAALNRPPIFVVIDPNGNVIPVPGSPFPEARELHVREALLATSALLSRNPRGFDQSEFLQGMFSAPAYAAAQQVLDADAREFLERQIHQKPQVARIDAIETSSRQVQVQVTGEVTRWGQIQQAPFSDSIPFTLRLVLQHNPDLLRQRHQPLVIESFDLRYASPKR